MKYITEKKRKIPVVEEVDVLIVGGGTAGAVAGIAAGRMKVNTLIIEQFGFLGGTQTGALVTPMMHNQVNGVQLNPGIGMEIMDRLKLTGDTGGDNNGRFNAEMLKYVLDDFVTEANVQVRFHTFASDAIVENGKIKGVVVESKSGRQAIVAKQVVDCTGDADIAVRAGVPYSAGREEDGMNQAMSLRFHLGNINLVKFCEFLNKIAPDRAFEQQPTHLHTASVWGTNWALVPYFERGVQEGILERSDGDYFQLFSVPGRPNELAFNCPRISQRVKGYDVTDLTYAQIEGRKKIRRLLAFMKKYFPGFENAYIVFTAPMVGVRESRRIKGEYLLTIDDIVNARKFPDPVARNNYPVDIHNPKGSGTKFHYQLQPNQYHEVPYRCLVPLKIDNLLVAGRCISATFEAQSSIRIQSNCYAFGEAAGIAAALCVKKRTTPRTLEYKYLKKYLPKPNLKP
ncbi:MAG: FAD-dependent oxidoreductase [bacterium]|nr:FAD-dependent oxidoreductase [bacterium]